MIDYIISADYSKNKLQSYILSVIYKSTVFVYIGMNYSYSSSSLKISNNMGVSSNGKNPQETIISGFHC